jgi:hypothetical protein
MCQHLSPFTFDSSNALLAAIGDATCGGAIHEKANNLFLSRAQKANEDISQFFSSLEMLWNRAFDVNSRSFQTFFRQFLAGLSNREVAKAIAEREPPIPPNLEDLRHAAIEIEERKNYYRYSNVMHQVLAKGGKSTEAYVPPAPSSNYRGEPMEIGSINKPRKPNNNQQKGPKGPNKSQGKNVSNANVNSGNLGTSQKPKNQPKPSNSNTKNSSGPKTGHCYNCGASGHYVPKCPKPRDPSLPFKNKGPKEVFNTNSVPELEDLEGDLWPSGSEVNTAALDCPIIPLN